eukprot:3936626-Rhodomonas_salina.4
MKSLACGSWRGNSIMRLIGLQQFFDDKHTICAILVAWLVGILVVFVWLGTESIPFFNIGPSEHTKLMGFAINTPGRWFIVALLTFWNTLFTEYVFDSLQPWLMTTVIDHKTIFLPYPKRDMLYMSVVCSTYRTVIQVVMMYVMLSQIDFLAIRMLADLVVTIVTTEHFLQNKRFAPFEEEAQTQLKSQGGQEERARAGVGGHSWHSEGAQSEVASADECARANSMDMLLLPAT